MTNDSSQITCGHPGNRGGLNKNDILLPFCKFNIVTEINKENFFKVLEN